METFAFIYKRNNNNNCTLTHTLFNTRFKLYKISIELNENLLFSSFSFIILNHLQNNCVILLLLL